MELWTILSLVIMFSTVKEGEGPFLLKEPAKTSSFPQYGGN